MIISLIQRISQTWKFCLFFTYSLEPSKFVWYLTYSTCSNTAIFKVSWIRKLYKGLPQNYAQSQSQIYNWQGFPVSQNISIAFIIFFYCSKGWGHSTSSFYFWLFKLKKFVSFLPLLSYVLSVMKRYYQSEWTEILFLPGLYSQIVSV